MVQFNSIESTFGPNSERPPPPLCDGTRDIGCAASAWPADRFEHPVQIAAANELLRPLSKEQMAKMDRSFCDMLYSLCAIRLSTGAALSLVIMMANELL